MSKPVHFYHLWTGGNWQDIAAEHFTVLDESGFDGEVFRCEVSDGWEDVTLRKLYEFCLTAHPDTPVLYAHAKGSFRPTYLREKTTGQIYQPDMNVLWRQGMTDRLVRPWLSRVTDLADYDLVGCHWIDDERPYFAGNFWWARAGYITALPALPKLDETNRWDAERWVASGSPRVKALSEGFASIPLPPTPGAKAVEWFTEIVGVE